VPRTDLFDLLASLALRAVSFLCKTFETIYLDSHVQTGFEAQPASNPAAVGAYVPACKDHDACHVPSSGAKVKNASNFTSFHLYVCKLKQRTTSWPFRYYIGKLKLCMYTISVFDWVTSPARCAHGRYYWAHHWKLVVKHSLSYLRSWQSLNKSRLSLLSFSLPALCGNQMIISTFTKTCEWILSRAGLIQTTTLCPYTLRPA
jgi:hypothetical protein